MLGIAACALPALVYRTTLDNPFIFDDRTTILLNPSLAAPWDLLAPLLQDLAHPLVNLSYAIDRGLWGYSSFGYHATSGILHLLVVGLLYGWCTRALPDGVTPGSDRGLTPEWGAFFVAATFGLHPLAGSAVAYVSARTELVGAVGFIASLIYVRRAILRSNRAAAAIAIGLGAAAVASSRAAAALPVVALAYDAWVLRAPRCRWRVTRIYVPATALIGILLAGPIRAALAADPVPHRGPIGNLLTEAIVAWRYLGLAVLPYGQSLVHDVRWVTSAADPLGLLALAGLVGLFVVAVRTRASAPLFAFGLAWCLATLVPTTSVVPLRDAMSEPRTYLPLAGLVFAVGSLLARPLALRPAVRLASASVLAIFAVLTWTRTEARADPVDVWADVALRAPASWQSHLEYAYVLREAGRCQQASDELAAARRLNDRLDPAFHLGAPCEAAVSR